jgi:hypothetical protein
MSPPDLDPELAANLGPLVHLVGTWEGDAGKDIAPQGGQPDETAFRERMSFDPLGPVQNREQLLWGLDYRTMAWPLGAEDAFHREVGYWLWDPSARHLMRCFMVPRGVTLIAGATCEPDARQFTLTAEAGSPTFGILSNPYLDATGKTIKYELTVTIHDDGSFHYAEDTVLQLAGRPAPFHHTDENTLRRV